MVNAIAPVVTTPAALALQPIYYPVLLHAAAALDIAADVHVTGPAVSPPGLDRSGRWPHRIADLGPFSLVDAAATVSVGRDRLAVTLVNRSENEPETVDLVLRDLVFRGDARIQCVTAERDPGTRSCPTLKARAWKKGQKPRTTRRSPSPFPRSPSPWSRWRRTGDSDNTRIDRNKEFRGCLCQKKIRPTAGRPQPFPWIRGEVGAMRRNLILLGTAALAAVTLAACSSSPGSSGSGSSASSGTTTIQFWVRSDIEAIAKQLVTKFNATHSNIKVDLTVTPDTYEVEKLGTAIASGNAPDVVALNDIDVPQFATEHELLDITSRAHALSFYKDLSPGQLSLGTYQGKLYGVPFDADLSIIDYNKTLFQKAGLNPNDPPTTWPEIISDAKKITALGNGIYGFDFQGDCSGCFTFTGMPFIWAAGGQIMPPNGNHATLTSAGVAAALNFYKTLWDDKVTPPSDQGATGATWGAAFQAGKIGMEPFDAGLGLAAQKAGVDVGITPIPGPNGGESTFAGGDDMVILANSPHAAAAWTFTQWALGVGPQTVIASDGYSPVRSDIVTSAFKAKYPLIAASLATLPHGNDPVGQVGVADRAVVTVIDMWETAIFRGNVTGAEQTAEQAFNSTLGG